MLAIVVAQSLAIKKQVVRSLRLLGINVQVHPAIPSQLPDKAVCIVELSCVDFGCPTPKHLVLLIGADQGTIASLRLVATGQAVPLAPWAMTHQSLAGAVLQSITGFNSLVRILSESTSPAIPKGMINAFLADPPNFVRLQDISKSINMPEATARRVLALRGFARAEHLTTFLRAESWKDLCARGLPRRLVERYLGIDDRTNFRRSCLRAGLEPPWVA